jgi:hypothetical protein
LFWGSSRNYKKRKEKKRKENGRHQAQGNAWKKARELDSTLATLDQVDQEEALAEIKPVVKRAQLLWI